MVASSCLVLVGLLLDVFAGCFCLAVLIFCCWCYIVAVYVVCALETFWIVHFCLRRFVLL